MEGIGKRIIELRKALNDISQGEFAQKIGIKQAVISNVEIGRNGASNSTIKLICLTLRVNESWLREGIGPMFTPPPEPPEPVIIDGRKLEPDEKELLDTYDKLVPETQEEVRVYAKEKLELQESRKKAAGDAPKQAPGGTTRPPEASQEAKRQETTGREGNTVFAEW
jgi:transcriptional regulator with XRE-family HTH domain